MYRKTNPYFKNTAFRIDLTADAFSPSLYFSLFFHESIASGNPRHVSFKNIYIKREQ